MAKPTLRKMHRTLFLGLILPLAPLCPALADSEPAALAKLQTMVANLGYTTTLASDNQSFSIDWTGNYNYKITFDIAQDGSMAYAYVPVITYTAAQMAKLQYVKLMEENDIGDFYFSMEDKSDGEALYANIMLPVTGLTPATLRTRVQGISDKLNDTANTWDTTTWK